MNNITVISLIGRKNVGKSTLFNKLLKSNISLTDNFSGLTRDRKYSILKINKKKINIIDTGGICFNSKSLEMQKKITFQSIIAIEESDIVLCILDAKKGILKEDNDIINIIRKKNKFFIVVVNKIDSVNSNILNEFYSLKVKYIFFISAIKGLGIKNLLKNIYKLNKKNKKKFNKKNIIKNEIDIKKIKKDIFLKKNFFTKISIVGKSNVGKSTLINCFSKENRTIVSNEKFTTRDSIYIPISIEKKKYILIDTAGIRKKNKIKSIEEKFSTMQTIDSINCSNIVIVVIDSNIGISLQDISTINFIIKKNKPLIIVFNKWDSISEKKKKIIKLQLKKNIYIFNFFRIHFISALYKKEVFKIFNSIKEICSNFEKKISNFLINKIMIKAYIEHKPPIIGKKRIIFKYAKILQNNSYIINIYGKRTKKIPKYYIKFLINYFHKSLKIIGIPIKIKFNEIYYYLK